MKLPMIAKAAAPVITVKSLNFSETACPENRPIAMVIPSVAGPKAPSAARPPKVRSTCRADHASTAASAMKAISTTAPHSKTIPQGNCVG